MTDTAPTCRKCGKAPAGPGGIICLACRQHIESGAAYEAK